MITFRPATDQDSDFVFETKKAAFKPYVEQVWGWNEDDQRAMHDRRFGLQDFEIVSKDGKDVAILATVSSSDKIDLTGVFVLPEFQRQGIGTECLAEVLHRQRQWIVGALLDSERGDGRWGGGTLTWAVVPVVEQRTK